MDAGSVVSSQVTGLSLYGCFVAATVPRGTYVTVKIISGTEFFESSAIVVHSEPERGSV